MGIRGEKNFKILFFTKKIIKKKSFHFVQIKKSLHSSFLKISNKNTQTVLLCKIFHLKNQMS